MTELTFTFTASGEVQQSAANQKTAFDMQATQYPATGPAGIGLERRDIELNSHLTTVDCLLYRDDSGALLGIFNHYNDNNPTQPAGSCNVWVHPDHQHRGIASVLLRDAWHLWPLAFADQTFTAAGDAWIHGLESKQKIDIQSEQSLNEDLDWVPPLAGLPHRRK